ncbi:MAG: hypothetical protein RL748_3659 [Pseudomonadota bacterium]
MKPSIRTLFCTLVTAAIASLTPPTLAQSRGFTVEDLVKMERIGSPALSPDGTQVVYTVRSFDLEANRGRNDLWLINLRDGAAKKLTNAATGSSASNEGNNASPVWSASGDAIYFSSSRSGSNQVWRLPVGDNSAAPTQVSALPLAVDSFKLSPDNSRIAMSLSVFRDCPDLACSKARVEQLAKNKSQGRLYKRLLFRHWDTQSDGRQQVLFASALTASHTLQGEPVSLSGSLDADVHSSQDGSSEDYAFSPDGSNVVFAARIAGQTEAWSTNFDLYRVPSSGNAAPQNLTPANKAWDAHPAFSPDGSTLAYLAMQKPGFESDRFQIMLLDVKSGKVRKLAEKWDRSAQTLRWSNDGKTLYTKTHDLGQVKLFGIDVATGKVSALTEQGSVIGFDVRGQAMVVAQARLDSGAQLFYRAPTSSQWQQLTHANDTLLAGVKMADYQQFSFPGAKGDKVYGYVMKPWNAKAGEKYPVALFVHGGPQGSFANNFTYRLNPQVLAGAGYGVLFIDIHGSLGYGQAFTDSVSQDWGGKPFQDLQLGMQAAAKQFPWLDSKNACALGVSFGGFMMNWIAGNWPDGFKCIVNHAGIFDTRAGYYSTDELWFNEWEYGGTYFDVPAKHEKFNPVNHVKKWKTPMLVTQGEIDYRIPSTQSISAFTALQRRGIESQLLLIPDEGHIFAKPANSLLWNRTILDWLGRHLKKTGQ